jgi:hypothetical protein
VCADWCNQEGVFLGDAGDGVFQGDLAVGMSQESAVRDGDPNWGTGCCFQIEQSYDGFIDEVECGAAVW